MSAVHYACKFGETAIIKLFLGTYKSDPNLITTAGKTALHYAVQFNQIECAKLMKGTYGANSELTDYSGLLPIHYANSENFSVYLAFLGSKRGFNKSNSLKKKFRSFDELSSITLPRRSISKDDLFDVISPRMRFNYSSMRKESKTAIFLEKCTEEK